MIIHTGTAVPLLVELWDPSDIDYIWFAWDDKLNGASISDSEWAVPADWTVVSMQLDASVTDDDGVSYDHANAALLSTTKIRGSHIVSNKVTLSDGRVFERSVKVKVKDL